MNPELVVLGVSAGGLEAVSTLLRDLPGTFTLALVVIQHRSRDSHALCELLQRSIAGRTLRLSRLKVNRDAEVPPTSAPKLPTMISPKPSPFRSPASETLAPAPSSAAAPYMAIGFLRRTRSGLDPFQWTPHGHTGRSQEWANYGLDPFQWTHERLGHKRLSTGSRAGASHANERAGLWVTAHSQSVE